MSEEGKDLTRAHVSRPEGVRAEVGTEGFPEEVGVLLGLTMVIQQNYHRRGCKSCLELSKAPFVRKKLECSNVPMSAFFSQTPLRLALLGLHSKSLPRARSERAFPELDV